jgi:hypothetical protein
MAICILPEFIDDVEKIIDESPWHGQVDKVTWRT